MAKPKRPPTKEDWVRFIHTANQLWSELIRLGYVDEQGEMTEKISSFDPDSNNTDAVILKSLHHRIHSLTVAALEMTTQRELSKIVGVGQAAIHGWRFGLTGPQLIVLIIATGRIRKWGVEQHNKFPGIPLPVPTCE